MAKIGPYVRLLSLLKYSLIFYRIDRSTNRKSFSNFEMHFLREQFFEGAILKRVFLKKQF